MNSRWIIIVGMALGLSIGNCLGGYAYDLRSTCSGALFITCGAGMFGGAVPAIFGGGASICHASPEGAATLPLDVVPYV